MLRNDIIQTNPQENYLHYHDDGLLDILIGMGIFMIGLGMLTDISFVFLSIIPAIWIPVWRDAKKRYTAPRMKYLHFTEAQRSAARTKAFLTVLLLAGILVFLAGAFAAVFWSQSTGVLPIWLQTLLKEYFWLFLGIFGAGVLSLIAWLYNLNRYFVYAALTLGIYTITYALKAPFWSSIVLTGGTITTCGSTVLLRFLREYPIEKHL
jgi:hypothetical protein